MGLNKSKMATQSAENLDKFKLFCWNVEGLSSNQLEARTHGVIEVISKEEPDVILLQEIIPHTFTFIKNQLLHTYDAFSSVDEAQLYNAYYFTMILIKRKTCELKHNKEILQFKNSKMGRNLLKVKLRYENRINICVMTTHLESLHPNRKQRVEQLNICLNEILNEDDDYYVLLGGDLNLTDKEIESIGGLPAGIVDLWESTSGKEDTKYTWDATKNSNIGGGYSRHRYDRLFYKEPKNTNSSIILKACSFELKGLQILQNCNRFCSDHWAMQCEFNLNMKE